MANINEPRYDTDLVNKAYVDNLIGDVSDTVDDTLQNIDYNKNFGSQPTPPYHMNDTWMDGTDIYTCINTRLIGEYVASDWTKASKYVTQTNLTNQLTDLDGSIQDILGDLQDQIDGVMEIHTYEGAPTLTNQPAINWTTDAIKKEHIGDIYNDMLTGDSYRFVLFDGVYQWLRISDSQAAAAYILAEDALALADNKRRIFSSEPFTPYDLGDLWTGGPTGALHRCKQSRSSGAFQIGDWEQATGYDNTKTVIDGGLVTTGTVTVVQGGSVAAGITGNTAGDNSIRFWAGSSLANRNNAPFRVTQAGKITASNADITGKITSSSATITGGSLKVGSRFNVDTSGNLTASNADLSGKITASSGTIGGWRITDTLLGTTGAVADTVFMSRTGMNAYINYFGISPSCCFYSKGNFAVTTDGKLYATNADISGKITATSGSFTGSITGATIQSSTMYTGTSSAGWVLTSNYIKARENGNTSIFSNGNVGFYGNHRIAAHSDVILNSQQGKGIVVGDGMYNAQDKSVKIVASTSSYIYLESSNGIRINGPISVSTTRTGARTSTFTGNPYYTYKGNTYKFIVINGLICGSERV